jgi:hypothetical protein
VKGESVPRIEEIIHPIRSVGAFLLGLLVAVIGTAAAEAPVYGVVRPAMAELLRMSYFLDAIVPAGLGYFAYYRWRLAQWQWVGVAGVCWFGLGVFRLRAAGSPAIYREMSGLGCVYDRSTIGCTYYPLFTSLSLRAISYSVGALCCLSIGTYLRRRARHTT